MQQKPGVIWKIYLIFFSAAVIGNLIDIRNPASPIYAFYHILIVFNENYTLAYFLNVASAFVNVASVLVVFLYIFQRNLLGRRFWQFMFFLRIVFDLTGRTYELNALKALFFSNHFYGLLSIALLFLFPLPSYIAFFKYAFREYQLSYK